MAAGLTNAPVLAEFAGLQTWSPIAVYLTIMLIVPIASNLAMPPMLTVTFMGSLYSALPDSQLDPTLLATALALGWTLNLTASPFGATALILSRITGIPRHNAFVAVERHVHDRCVFLGGPGAWLHKFAGRLILILQARLPRRPDQRIMRSIEPGMCIRRGLQSLPEDNRAMSDPGSKNDMMKKLLATTALVAFAATSTLTIAHAAEVDGPEVKWNVSLWGKQRAFTAGFEKLAELVNAKTDGKFTMTLHYGAALSKSRENLDGISVGAFEAAMTCNFYHPQKKPRAHGVDHAVPANVQLGRQSQYPRCRLCAPRHHQGARPVERHALHVILPAAV